MCGHKNRFKHLGSHVLPRLFAGALLLCATGCGWSDSDDDATTQVKVVELRGTAVHNSPSVGMPFLIRMTGDYLWVEDGVGDPSLHLIDPRSGRLIRSVGRSGEGPGEFSGTPMSMIVPPGHTGDSIWAWDRRTRRLVVFSGDDAGASSVQLPRDAGLYKVAWIDPDRIVGVGPSGDGIGFAMFARDGAQVGSKQGRLLGPEDAPIAARRTITLGGMDICGWPGRGFAMIYYEVARIEYYDREMNFVKTASVPYPSEAFVENDSGDLVPVRDIDRYRACKVHNDRLFALFSGRDSSYEGSARYAGESVHVFDWDGELRASIGVHPEVNYIDVFRDWEGDVIYGTSESDATVYRFSLVGSDLEGVWDQ